MFVIKVAVMTDNRLKGVKQIRFFIKVSKKINVIKENESFNHIIVLVNAIHRYFIILSREVFFPNDVVFGE